MGKIFGIVLWFLELITGGGKKQAGFDDGRELGAATEQNKELKDGMATVRAAEKAARKVEQEETGDEPDPMDRARR